MIRSSHRILVPKKGLLERKTRRRSLTPTLTDEINSLLRRPKAAIERLFPQCSYSFVGFDKHFIFPAEYRRFLEEVSTHKIAKTLRVKLTLAKKLKGDINVHGELTEETLRWFLVQRLSTRAMKIAQGYR